MSVGGKIDSVTARWIRNASDELAVANGCWFDESRGQHVIDFAERYLRLYEGDQAGEPLIPRDWQIEATMRLFGWVRHSDRLGRTVRRFRRASIWVPKKNKKSPTLAWWALYLGVADGEMGQKVYLCAKDGAQARDIAGKHTIEMVLASDELQAECSINRSLCQITHEPTRSIIKPISSGDSKAAKAKEGLNGSTLVDETHVVDWEFVTRIVRAGISRSEPLHIEVSTAGKDPSGYGKAQWDYGLRVEAGQERDDSFFFLAYAAPQDLSDEELHADPVKYGKMANPAWGHTVHEDEYLDDYSRSRKSIADLADFKTYRLNIWQRSANPWLRASDWLKCQDDSLSLKDFEGESCWAGLDKSKTTDMSSLVLVFRRDVGDVTEYCQFPFYWLPERTVWNMSNKEPTRQWADNKQLLVIPGEVIEDRYIEDVVADLASRFRIQELRYDRTFAHDITLRIEEDHGIQRVEFPQTTMQFAGPIEDYERLVIQGRLRHNGHPVLSWQAGHCQVHTDSKGRKTLVKPKHGDHKKIDGMVAGVMALSGALAATDSAAEGSLFIY